MLKNQISKIFSETEVSTTSLIDLFGTVAEFNYVSCGFINVPWYNKHLLTRFL